MISPSSIAKYVYMYKLKCSSSAHRVGFSYMHTRDVSPLLITLPSYVRRQRHALYNPPTSFSRFLSSWQYVAALWVKKRCVCVCVCGGGGGDASCGISQGFFCCFLFTRNFGAAPYLYSFVLPCGFCELSLACT